MAKTAIDTKGKQISTIARRTALGVADGDAVILNFGREPDPIRIMKTINALHGEFEIELVVRHAELRQYLEGAITGAAVGAGVGAGASLVLALAAGNPISLGAIAASAGLGALLGGLIGAGSASVHTVTVYKHNGETRIKIIEAH